MTIEQRRDSQPGFPNAPAPVVSLQGCRILVVDDSPDNRLLVTRFLARTGAVVSAAEDGKQGVEKASSEEFDVILMDIQMPVLDGFEALAALRKLGVATPVVALTAHAGLDERERVMRAGFTDYVSKPISRSVLEETIDRVRPPSRL